MRRDSRPASRENSPRLGPFPSAGIGGLGVLAASDANRNDLRQIASISLKAFEEQARMKRLDKKASG